jgi:hypothetical protein
MTKCESCSYISTPKGKQCYTITRTLKEQVRDKGLPFYPNIVIPVLEVLGKTCKRYREKRIRRDD